MSALATAYAPDRIGRKFGYRSTAYSKNRDARGRGIHRGLDVRKLSADGTHSVVTEVAAIHAGKVVYVGRPNSLIELTIVIDRGSAIKRGRFESHSHNANPKVRVGAKVTPGATLARNASLDERPGLITGVHDHITITDHIDGAWNLARVEYDPLPFIAAALAREIEQQTPSTPRPAGTTEGTDMAVYVKAKSDTRVFEISQGKKYHLTADAWAAIRAAYAAAKLKLPFSTGKLTKQQVDRIPNG